MKKSPTSGRKVPAMGLEGHGPTKVDHLQNFHVPRPTLRVKRKVTSVKAEVVVPLFFF